MSDNPYAPPKAKLEHTADVESAHQHGRWVVWNGSEFPQACLVCGANDIVAKRIKLVWRPAWWRYGGLALGFAWFFIAPGFVVTLFQEVGTILWLVGLLLFVGIHFLIRQVVPLQAGWCASHRRYRRLAMIASFVLGLSLVSLTVTYPTFALIGLLLYLLAILLLQISPWRWLLTPIQIGRRRDNQYWISGSGNGFRKRLPEF